MRFYAFCNYYLSSLQQGLQAAHVLTEMSMKARLKGGQYWQQYDNWASDHKTIILLNGGNDKDLRELLTFFNTPNPYLYASFCEDQQSLNGAMTCVGIILPENIYESSAALRRSELYFSGEFNSQCAFDEGAWRDDIETERLCHLRDFINNTSTGLELEMVKRLGKYGLAK
jgi:hypothetical protein